MQYSSLILAVLAAIWAQPVTAGARLTRDAMKAEVAKFDSYEKVELVWAVNTTFGTTEYVNGTIQDVIAYLDVHDPTHNVTEQVAAFESLEGPDLRCGAFPSVAKDGPAQGILYLLTVNGEPAIGPGTHACGRVSCSHDAGIWWCNDSPTSKKIRSFALISGGAKRIVDSCHVGCKGRQTSGQYYFDDGWHVIVRKEDCYAEQYKSPPGQPPPYETPASSTSSRSPRATSV